MGDCHFGFFGVSIMFFLLWALGFRSVQTGSSSPPSSSEEGEQKCKHPFLSWAARSPFVGEKRKEWTRAHIYSIHLFLNCFKLFLCYDIFFVFHLLKGHPLAPVLILAVVLPPAVLACCFRVKKKGKHAGEKPHTLNWKRGEIKATCHKQKTRKRKSKKRQ